MFRKTNIPWWAWLLLLKIAYVVCLAFFHPQACFSTDAYGYLTMAENIWNFGTSSRNELPPLLFDTLRTPGYPLFIILTGGLYSVWFTVMAQQLVHVLAAFCLYKLIKHFQVSEKVAKLAAGIYLLDIPSFVISTFLLSDILFQALLVFSFFFLLKKQSLWWSAIMLVLACYVRPAGLYFGLIWGVYVVFSHTRKKWIPAVAVLFISLSFWGVRNYIHHQRFIFSTAGEFNWCSWHGANIIAQQKNIPIGQAQQYWWGHLSDVYPLDPEQNQVQYSTFISQQSSALMVNHPWFFAKQTFEGIAMLWLKPMRSHLDMQWQLPTLKHDGSLAGKLKANTWLSWSILCLQLLAMLCLYPLAVVGWFTLRKNNTALAYFLLASLLYFSLLILPPTTYARLRLPLVPFVTLLASMSYQRFYNRYFSTKKIGA
jgi:hypothetical protein